jgi:hypothetical protein
MSKYTKFAELARLEALRRFENAARIVLFSSQ